MLFRDAFDLLVSDARVISIVAATLYAIRAFWGPEVLGAGPLTLSGHIKWTLITVITFALVRATRALSNWYRSWLDGKYLELGNRMMDSPDFIEDILTDEQDKQDKEESKDE